MIKMSSGIIETPSEPNLVIVDDSEAIVRALGRKFKKYFQEIYYAYNPQEGENIIFNQRKPHIVISDMEMLPYHNGLRMAQITFKHRYNLDSPFILHSGNIYDYDDEITNLKQMGVIDSAITKSNDAELKEAVLSYKEAIRRLYMGDQLESA